jgi:carbonic anhydrase
MSCHTATSPVNIVKHESEKCDLKCDYSFQYGTTSIRAYNEGDHFSFAFDKSVNPPVLYNSEKYDVDRMRLYQPSLHTWHGQKAKAELIIEHSAVTSTGSLMVCIPIESTGSQNGVLDAMISQAGSTAPTDGSSATIAIPSFTLNSLVPHKPFFNYRGSLPYEPCNGTYEYVVFGREHAVGVTKATEKIISKIVKANAYHTHKNRSGVFFNSKGAGSAISTSGEGEIYIECHPTGSDGETLVPEPKSGLDLKGFGEAANKLLKSDILSSILGVIILLALLKLFHYILTKLFGTGGGAQAGGSSSILGHAA